MFNNKRTVGGIFRHDLHRFVARHLQSCGFWLMTSSDEPMPSGRFYAHDEERGLIETLGVELQHLLDVPVVMGYDSDLFGEMNDDDNEPNFEYGVQISPSASPELLSAALEDLRMVVTRLKDRGRQFDLAHAQFRELEDTWQLEPDEEVPNAPRVLALRRPEKGKPK